MRFRILTLNVWGLPWPAARDASARMRAIGAALPRLGLDVATFQEVWTAGARSALVADGAAAGLGHVWPDPQTRSGGLLVLSRLPIAGARFDSFDLGGFPERLDHGDYFGGKGFADVRLATPSGNLHVVATHLQAGYGPRRRDAYVGHRTAQVVALADRVRRTGEPVVVAGDLNFQDMYEEYGVLIGLTGLADAARVLDRRQDTVLRESPYRVGRRGSSSRVDFVLYRDGGERSLRPLSADRVLDEAIEIGGREARMSDHAGVLVEFEIAAGGCPPPPPDPAATTLARRLLTAGREDARRRQRRRLASGAAAVLVAPLALKTGPPARIARRGVLRSLFRAGAGLIGGVGAGALWLALVFGPRELRAYDASLRRLDDLEPPR